MDKLKTLGEVLESGCFEGHYFSSDVPFYNQGLDFMLYRIPREPKPSSEMYIVVVPAKYDEGKGEFIELTPVEVFKAQHLGDDIFVPRNSHELIDRS